MAGREPYSPRHRTALVLTGTGTAGAYHAGVLRALAEAGVRIDLVAGHGAGRHRRDVHGHRRGPRPVGPGWILAAEGRRRFLRLAAPSCAPSAGPGAAALALVARSAGRPRRRPGRLPGLAPPQPCRARRGAGRWPRATRRSCATPSRRAALASWVPRASLLLRALVLAALASRPLAARIAGRTRERGRFWWRVFGAPRRRRAASSPSGRARSGA